MAQAAAGALEHAGAIGLRLGVWLLAGLQAVASPVRAGPAFPGAGGPSADVAPACAADCIRQVRVEGDPAQSYALYLPPGHDPRRPYPILYCFDPRGRGTPCAERFRVGARRHGFIVAASNNSRSDWPTAPNIVAMRAIWKDTHARMTIDDDRAYATGFSGGARIAVVMGRVLGLAGVIGVGAGFPPEAPPGPDVPFSYFGMVGEADFNYYEMRQLEGALDRLGLAHRIDVFAGGHVWGPEELCARALDWMQLRAMAEGRLASDRAIVDAAYAAALASAVRHEQLGRPFAAWAAYLRAARDFESLGDTADARTAAERLEAVPRVRRERRRRARWDAWGAERLDRLNAVMGRLAEAGRAPTLPELLGRLEISSLQRQARGEGEAARAGRRVLAAIHVQAAFYRGVALLEAGDFARAALSFGLATRVRPNDEQTWYNLARARAREGKRGHAIEALRRAVDEGFRDTGRLRADPDLQSIRETREFRTILARAAG